MRGLHQKTLTTIASMVFSSAAALAGNATGNGGDHVRAMFMRMGDAAIDYVAGSEEGRKMLSEAQITLEQLKRQNSIEVIGTTDQTLIDNRGSIVDAIGESGKITISNERWLNHFENNRDVYFLVLHELLRAAAVNDDNYVYSKIAQNFPVSRKILTRMNSIYPILDEIPLSRIIDKSQILVVGSGCPQAGGAFSDFDVENNSLSLEFKKYDLVVGGNGVLSASKNCAIRIPVTPPAGTKISIAHIDFSAKGSLKEGAEVATSARSTFNSTSNPIEKKSFKADQDQMGRLLIRLNQNIVSNCDGIGEILKVDSAASIITPRGSDRSIFSGEKLQIYFKVESCSNGLNQGNYQKR